MWALGQASRKPNPRKLIEGEENAGPLPLIVPPYFPPLPLSRVLIGLFNKRRSPRGQGQVHVCGVHFPTPELKKHVLSVYLTNQQRNQPAACGGCSAPQEWNFAHFYPVAWYCYGGSCFLWGTLNVHHLSYLDSSKAIVFHGGREISTNQVWFFTSSTQLDHGLDRVGIGIGSPAFLLDFRS